MKSTIDNLFSQTPERLLTDEEQKDLTRRAANRDRQAGKTEARLVQ